MAKIEFCFKLLLSGGSEIMNDEQSFTSLPVSGEVVVTNDIRAMISSEGEKVKFVKVIHNSLLFYLLLCHLLFFIN